MKWIGIALSLLAFGAGLLPAIPAQPIPSSAPGVSGGYLRPISLEEYAKELDRLRTVVGSCSQELQRKTMARKACNPSLAGPDEVVSVASGKRILQYDWLRDSLQDAAMAERGKNDRNAWIEASAGLRDAGARLEQMTREMAHPGGYTPFDVAGARRKLDAILSSGDFPQSKPPSYWDRIWNDFWRWLLTALAKVMPSSSSTTAIYLLELTVIALPCGVLIWWFVRKLRVQKLGLPRESVPHPSAPSGQDWQQWLEQGQSLANERRWREAIHHVYWSAISCLESRLLWPADRTRTPREYLGLLSGNPETRADLVSLTSWFEHTWYGERPAGQKDFDQACRVLERIAAR